VLVQKSKFKIQSLSGFITRAGYYRWNAGGCKAKSGAGGNIYAAAGITLTAPAFCASAFPFREGVAAERTG
jgi:hypothetical protein